MSRGSSAAGWPGLGCVDRWDRVCHPAKSGPRGLAGKPLAGFRGYAKQTYSSLMRYDSKCNTFQ